MKRILFLLFLCILGCDSSKEERLGFGISKKQADKILSSNGPVFSEADSYCVEKQFQEVEDVQFNKIDNRYYINNSSGKSLKYLSLKFYKTPKKKLDSIGWKYFSDTDFDQLGRFKIDTSKRQNCFPLGEEIGIKGTALGSYVLILPENDSLVISELKVYSNEVQKKASCDYQTDLNQLQKSYLSSIEEPESKEKFIEFFKLILKSIKPKDCKREIDTHSVPKYYFCGYDRDLSCTEDSPRLWFRHLETFKEKYPVVEKMFQSVVFQKYLRETEAEFRRKALEEK